MEETTPAPVKKKTNRRQPPNNILRRTPGLDSNPVRVARLVKEKLLKGEKIVLGKILKEVGYSKATQNAPSRVTERIDYKNEMGDFVDKLEQHRQDVLKAMMRKNLDEEQYRTLSDSSSKLTHDVQLLRGGRTENVGVEEDRKTLIAIIASIRGVEGPQPTETLPTEEMKKIE